MEIKTNLYNFLNIIPTDKVVSYSFLSKLFCNHPRGIGRINASNPYPDEFNCYKVVGSTGSLNGYILGLDEKIKRLKKDGIELKNGIIEKKHFRYPKVFNFFAAFPLGEPYKKEFEKMIGELKDSLGTKNFTFQQGNTPHITLRFFGDIDFGQFKNIVDETLQNVSILNDQKYKKPFEIKNFNNFGKKVYFMEPLKDDFKDFESIYKQYSSIIDHDDQKTFHPHMTLFRSKDPAVILNIQVINNIISKYKFDITLDKIRFYAAVDSHFQVPLIDINIT